VHPSPIAILLLCIIARFAVACSSPHPPTEVRRMVEETTAAAEDHAAAGEPHEAAELTRAVLAIDPDFIPALEVREALPDDLDPIDRSRVLGANLAKRVPVERSMTAKVLLYPVDRFLDLPEPQPSRAQLDGESLQARAGARDPQRLLRAP
jgi:hypothetical protein